MRSFRYTPPSDVAAFLNALIHSSDLPAQTWINIALRFLELQPFSEIDDIVYRVMERNKSRRRERKQSKKEKLDPGDPPKHSDLLKLIFGEKPVGISGTTLLVHREKKGPTSASLSGMKISYG